MAGARGSSSGSRGQAWRMLLETHGLVFGRLAAEMRAATGMPITWYDVLLHLAEAPGRRLRMGQLAEALVLTKSGLTGLVDRLEAAGLVQREAIRGDRRATNVVLTPTGQARFDDAVAVHRAWVRRLFIDCIDEADARALIRALEKVRATLGASVIPRRANGRGRGGPES